MVNTSPLASQGNLPLASESRGTMVNTCPTTSRSKLDLSTRNYDYAQQQDILQVLRRYDDSLLERMTPEYRGLLDPHVRFPEIKPELPLGSEATPGSAAGVSLSIVEATPERTTGTEPSASSFPTDQREKQKVAEKERKAKGITVKKRPKHIEPGLDDCGEDFSAIQEVEFTAYGLLDEACTEDVADEVHPSLSADSHFVLNYIADLRPDAWLFGSDVEGMPYNSRDFIHYEDTEIFLANWWHDNTDGALVDTVEICGGNARTSFMLVRRRHVQPERVGLNFDAVMGIDLTKPSHIKAF